MALSMPLRNPSPKGSRLSSVRPSLLLDCLVIAATVYAKNATQSGYREGSPYTDQENSTSRTVTFLGYSPFAQCGEYAICKLFSTSKLKVGAVHETESSCASGDAARSLER